LLDRRFRRVWDRERLPAIEAFDAGDDNHLDELACHLLERFRLHGDTEAFVLLFEVAGARLQQIAGRLAARLQATVAPGDLVSALKRRIWVGEGLPLTGNFLAVARGLMELQLRIALTGRPDRGRPHRRSA
jgi:hypothetical protein